MIDVVGLMSPERILRAFSVLFDSIDDGLVLVDADWCIVYANPIAARQLAPTSPEAITPVEGRDIRQLLPIFPASVGERIARSVSERLPAFIENPAGAESSIRGLITIPLDAGTFVALKAGTSGEAGRASRRTLHSLSSVLESGGIGFAVVDERLRLTHANRVIAPREKARGGGRPRMSSQSTLTPRLLQYARYVRKTGRSMLSIPIPLKLGLESDELTWMAAFYPIKRRGRSGIAIAAVELSEKKRLQTTLEWWRNILEHATWGFVVVEPGIGRVVETNAAYAAMHGYSHDELKGEAIDALLAPEDRDVIAVHRQALNERVHHTFQIDHKRRDGSRFPVLVRATTFRDASGRAVYYAAVCEDITELKRLQRDLETSRERLQLAIDGARLGTWRWNASDGLLTWSARKQEIFGVALDGPVTVDFFFSMVHPDDRDRIRNEVEQMLRSPCEFQMEYRVVRPDGALRWVCDKGRSFASLEVDPGSGYGNPAAVVYAEGIIEDIDERKRSEASARERETQFRRFAESDVIGVIICYPDGRITFANDRFLNMVGYSRADLEAGMLNWRSMTPVEYTEIMDLHWSALRRRGTAEYEKVYIGKDGRRVPVLIGMATLSDDGDGVIAFVLDLTARKRAEEQIKQAIYELGVAYTKEHRIATSLQRSLLHRPSTEVFGPIEIDAVYRPAADERLIGGDFYDIVPLQNGIVAIVIGDVSSKGLEATAQTNEVKHVLRAYLFENPEPGPAMENLNRYLCRHFAAEDPAGDRFVSLTLAVIDPSERRARIAVAAAEPPILRRRDRDTSLVTARGLALGIVDTARYAVSSIDLDIGDMLILATDGVTEVGRGSLFLGAEGLAGIAGQIDVGHDLHAFNNTLLDRARQFGDGEFRDEVCLLVCRFQG